MASIGHVLALVFLGVGAAMGLTGLFLILTDGEVRGAASEVNRNIIGVMLLAGGGGQAAAGLVVGLLAQIADWLDAIGGRVDLIEKRQADAGADARAPSVAADFRMKPV